MSTIKHELEALRDQSPILQPGDVVTWAATHEDSALHRRFEWDDAKAGDEYRLQQARRLISLHIGTESREPTVMSLSIDRGLPGGGYRKVNDVMRSPTLRQIALQDAIGELERLRDKYENVRELALVFKAIADTRTLHAVPARDEPRIVHAVVA